MKRYVALAVVTAAFIGCGQSNKSPVTGEGQVTAAAFNPEDAPTVEFSVPDMYCPEGCGVAVKEILAKQPGAKDVRVDFETKTATVAVDDLEFDSDKVIAALVDHQFGNSSLKGGPAPNAGPELKADGQSAEAVQ